MPAHSQKMKLLVVGHTDRVPVAAGFPCFINPDMCSLLAVHCHSQLPSVGASFCCSAALQYSARACEQLNQGYMCLQNRCRIAAAILRSVLAYGGSCLRAWVCPAGLQKKLLDLFMSFPFNNLLHQQTAIMLYFALENGTDNLLAHLLEECQLLQWVAHAPQEVKPEPRPMDERGAERPPIRAGNLGHLTLIANRYVSVH